MSLANPLRSLSLYRRLHWPLQLHHLCPIPFRRQIHRPDFRLTMHPNLRKGGSVGRNDRP